MRASDPAANGTGLPFEMIRKDPQPPHEEKNFASQATIKLLRGRKVSRDLDSDDWYLSPRVR